jgi:hypothetical protein
MAPWWSARRFSLLASGFLLLLPAGAGQAGVRDFAEVWLLDGEQTSGWLALGDPEGLQIPDGGFSAGLEAGQGNLFGLSQLSQTYLAVAASWRNWRLRAAWQQLGRPPVREQLRRLELEFGGRWLLGLGLDHRQLQFSGLEDLGRYGGRVWFGYRWEVGAEGELRLVYSQVDDRQRRRQRHQLLDAQWQEKNLVLSLRVDRKAAGAPVGDLQVLLRLAGGMALGLRCDLGSGSIGPGVHFRRGRLLLRTSHLAHPQLGLTHRFALRIEA